VLEGHACDEVLLGLEWAASVQFVIDVTQPIDGLDVLDWREATEGGATADVHNIPHIELLVALTAAYMTEKEELWRFPRAQLVERTQALFRHASEAFMLDEKPLIDAIARLCGKRILRAIGQNLVLAIFHRELVPRLGMLRTGEDLVDETVIVGCAGSVGQRKWLARVASRDTIQPSRTNSVDRKLRCDGIKRGLPRLRRD
jgi:hypothetical protein